MRTKLVDWKLCMKSLIQTTLDTVFINQILLIWMKKMGLRSMENGKICKFYINFNKVSRMPIKLKDRRLIANPFKKNKRTNISPHKFKFSTNLKLNQIPMHPLQMHLPIFLNTNFSMLISWKKGKSANSIVSAKTVKEESKTLN